MKRIWIYAATLAASLVNLPAEEADEVIALFRAGDDAAVIARTEGVKDGTLAQVRAAALERRGEQHFFDGEIAEAIADFDAVIALFPEQDPHHWQRGLAYYYAGEYAKGKAQFERHQTVNTQDVENAVWHFLCAVRAEGGSVETARKDLIPIEHDSRVPMAQVHDLFAGRGTVEQVLEAAGDERNALCYAHLYLALYFEALGETEKSAEHIRKAAFDHSMDHYMGKTAQVHAKLRGIEAKP